MDSAKAPGGGQDFRIVALLPAHNEAESIATTVGALQAQTRIPDAMKHLGLRFVSPKSATMSTEAMLTWKDLARQRLRWKRGAFEDLLSFGLSRHTLKGWGLQLVSTLGVMATLVYMTTLVLSPWLGIHPRLWFLAITVVYAVERAITVRARGCKIQLLSVATFPEWFYDLFLQSVQVRALWGAVWRTSKSW